MLTNNERKDIIKVIVFLENRGLLLKGISRKVTGQEGELLYFLSPLIKVGLPLITNVLTLAKSILIPLGLTTATSATDAAIQKKIFGSGTTLIISDEEMNDIIKLVISLEDSGLLIRGVKQTIKKEAKEQKGIFLDMLLSTLGTSLLGNMLAEKVALRSGEETIRSGQDF